MSDAIADEPICAQKGPYRVELLEGYRYAWCACGCKRSAKFPFCDGTHKKL